MPDRDAVPAPHGDVERLAQERKLAGDHQAARPPHAGDDREQDARTQH